ncbi:hypothetical protein D9M72_622420 [compost metagenome]
MVQAPPTTFADVWLQFPVKVLALIPVTTKFAPLAFGVAVTVQSLVKVTRLQFDPVPKFLPLA